MKIIITENQLNEVVSKSKSEVGNGLFHRVFPSEKYPDKVFKVGPSNVVDHWVGIFKDHPDLFPKIHFVKKYRFHDVPYKYVLLERLDVRRFERFWDVLDKVSVKVSKRPIQYILNGILFNESGPTINVIKEYLDENITEYSNDFIYLTELFDKLFEISKRADLHKLQFGYDKSGKIKCLDI
jgi:hypothetical protein